MTDRILPHWYKEKRTKKHRRVVYNFLRLMGFEIYAAKRARDWSNSHIRRFIIDNEFCKVKDERT